MRKRQITDHGTLGEPDKCYYCREECETTRDHFWPQSQGGVLKVYCCEQCNFDKDDLLPRQWIFYASRNYEEPKASYVISATEKLWEQIKDDIEELRGRRMLPV